MLLSPSLLPHVFIVWFSELKAIFTSAGRIVPVDDNGEVLYQFEYNLQDHLGNTRVVFAGNNKGRPTVLQVNEYYPFGMVLSQQNYFADGILANKYLYNGKELQDDDLGGVSLDWYDYGARFYDPALGRWHSIDPLSEKYFGLSPYNYVSNDPIRLFDPDGTKIDTTMSKGGGQDGRDLITYTVTGKFINFSGDDINKDKALSDIISYIEKMYQGSDIDGVDYAFKLNFSVAQNMSDVDSDDHLFVLADKITVDGDKKLGVVSHKGGLVASVDGSYFKGWLDNSVGKIGEYAFAHEFGHLLGLGYPKHNTKMYNLMNAYAVKPLGTRLSTLNKNQFKQIKYNFNSGQLNKGYNMDLLGLPNRNNQANAKIRLLRTYGRGADMLNHLKN